MASGGMDWFRWHHGSVNDPKFQLVARKVGCSLAEVIAVWACVLEAASQAEERGAHGALDFEALDCSLGLPDGRTQDIYLRMQDRALVDGETVTAWHKRQPKREREDDNSTDRVRKFRKQNQTETPDTKVPAATPGANGVTDDVTPCNAKKRQETPRGEERRVDTSVCVSRATAVCAVMRSAGMASVNPSSPELAKLLEAGAEVAAFELAAKTAVDQGKGFGYALGIVRNQLADADRMAAGVRDVTAGRKHSTQPRGAESFAERDREAGMRRWEQMTGEVHPDRVQQGAAQVIDVVDVSQQHQLARLES